MRFCLLIIIIIKDERSNGSWDEEAKIVNLRVTNSGMLQFGTCLNLM